MHKLFHVASLFTKFVKFSKNGKLAPTKVLNAARNCHHSDPIFFKASSPKDKGITELAEYVSDQILMLFKKFRMLKDLETFRRACAKAMY